MSPRSIADHERWASHPESQRVSHERRPADQRSRGGLADLRLALWDRARRHMVHAQTLQEEVGELTQAFLMLTGRARDKGATPDLKIAEQRGAIRGAKWGHLGASVMEAWFTAAGRWRADRRLCPVLCVVVGGLAGWRPSWPAGSSPRRWGSRVRWCRRGRTGRGCWTRPATRQ
jgi:hypothetical protein